MNELNEQQKIELGEMILKTVGEGVIEWNPKNCANIADLVLSKIKELESSQPTGSIKPYKVDSSRVYCIDECEFMPHRIGSVGCDECPKSEENNQNQNWVICELYNKE